jgi:YebC/PmpR family DNA-binding regulatory protein
MAGHSHWANIQRKKSAVDAKRGKVFSKWAKLIANAARTGGGDPDMNLSLRYAMDRARADNMPKDSIDRAVKKGTGELGGAALEEVVYEAYGPNGVAIIIESLTDNRARTAPDLRYILDRKGGSLANSGAVAWMFERKAAFVLQRSELDEDEVMMVALDNGAEDVTTDEAEIIGVTGPQYEFHNLKTAFDEAGYETLDGALRYIPNNFVEIDQEAFQKISALMDALEDNDDVQEVHNNAELST